MFPSKASQDQSMEKFTLRHTVRDCRKQPLKPNRLLGVGPSDQPALRCRRPPSGRGPGTAPGLDAPGGHIDEETILDVRGGAHRKGRFSGGGGAFEGNAEVAIVTKPH